MLMDFFINKMKLFKNNFWHIIIDVIYFNNIQDSKNLELKRSR